MTAPAAGHAGLAIAIAAMLVLAAWVRRRFIGQAAALKVDHYYWLQAAERFRRGGGFPMRFDSRYLLEPREQAYPPLFGWLLGRLPTEFVASPSAVWLSHGADAAALAIVAALGVWIGTGPPGLIALLITALFAPTLVAYNTQLNPRSLGNLFLVAKMACEVTAAGMQGPESWLLVGLAVVATAGVWLTHKMTTQLMLALSLPWGLALGSSSAALSPVAGLVLAAAVVGPGAMLYQLVAHLDIVRFWSRNWPYLGVNMIRESPIYGERSADAAGAYHQRGWSNLRQQFRLIFGYAPALALLPLTIPFAPDVPAWLVVWAGGTLVWAALTALVGPLKGFGAGPLYIFFAVIPAGLWLGLIIGHPAGQVVLMLTLAATAAALALGWRQRQARRIETEDGFVPLIERLRALPAQRLAALPLTAAEPIAGETHHAVMWGGHGYGFDRLEPVFPRVTRPLGETFARYAIDRLVWSKAWWPEAEVVLSREFRLADIEAYGAWRVARIEGLPKPPRPRVCFIVPDAAAVGGELATIVRGGEIEVQLLERRSAMATGIEPGGAPIAARASADGLMATYRLLRRWHPDIADCRHGGTADVLVAGLAGVPCCLFREPVTAFEKVLVRSGLARPASADVLRSRDGAGLAGAYRQMFAATPEAR